MIKRENNKKGDLMKNIIMTILIAIAFFGCEDGPLQVYESFIAQCDCNSEQECHDNAQLIGTYFYVNPLECIEECTEFGGECVYYDDEGF